MSNLDETVILQTAQNAVENRTQRVTRIAYLDHINQLVWRENLESIPTTNCEESSSFQ